MTNPFSLHGRHALVTGANTGIGQAIAVGLAAAGATVVCAGRRPCDETVAQITQAGATASSILVDFTDPMAGQTLFTGQGFDILINNAGIGVDRRQETVDGFELTFAVNHLAPFVLTTELLDLLEASAPARVITVASANHVGAKTLDLDDLQSRKRFAWRPARSSWA